MLTSGPPEYCTMQKELIIWTERIRLQAVGTRCPLMENSAAMAYCFLVLLSLAQFHAVAIIVSQFSPTSSRTQKTYCTVTILYTQIWHTMLTTEK
jgi:hypothetical protein